MKDVTDGKYAGEMTPAETISQLEYRAGIHLSYINLMEEYPNQGWEIYGTVEYHDWAINGYSEAIRHIKDRPEKYVNSQLRVLTIIGRAIMKLFRG